MNLLFINKYQPLFFDDFTMNSQDDKVMILLLKQLISINDINIMLIGPVGSRKTTLLNTIVREYYNNENINNNILKINNLKEHGINYYRTDVKIFCQTHSLIKNKKKFLILDDIDQIDEQCQQVLRSCIDKYHKNIHFICSCSNNQKVIESLQSRLNVIKLNKISIENIKIIMNYIMKNENIYITADAEQFLLNTCNNTIKTIVNYLEKFKLMNELITLEIVIEECSSINFYNLNEYIQSIKTNNLQQAIQILFKIYEKGYSTIDIFDSLFNYVKYTDVLLSEDEKYKLLPLLCKYISIFYDINEDKIELAFFTNECLLTIALGPIALGVA